MNINPSLSRISKYIQIIIAEKKESAELWRLTTERKYFDPEYYRATYRDILEQKDLAHPYQHYFQEGWFHGLKPNPTLDPIAIWLSGKMEALPCEELYTNLIKCNIFISDDFRFGGMEATNIKKIENKGNETQPNQYANTELNVRKEKYIFENYDPGTIFTKIKKSEPVIMLRLPHGFWDATSSIHTLAQSLLLHCENERLFSYSAFVRLSTRLLNITKQGINHGLLKDDIFYSTCKKIEELNAHPQIDIGISFKGFPGADSHPFKCSSKRVANQTNELLFFQHYLHKRNKFFDATLFKRWAILGELKKLPSVLSHRTVIIVGPIYLENLSDVWQVPIHFVKIEPDNSQSNRHRILSELFHHINSINDKSKAIIFTQCGGSFAFWLGLEVVEKYPNISFLDMGQALDIWHEEDKGKKWLEIYKDDVARHRYKN